MSRYLKIGLVALATSVSTLTYSQAADLDPPQPVIEHKPVIKGKGGFYLRGDVGYSLWNEPELAFNNPPGGFTNAFIEEETDNAFVFGVGAGYKFRKYLRFDVTADIRTNKDITATSVCGTCIVGPIAATGFIEQQQETTVDISTFFANAYFDLGTFKRFTPYIGGGVGVAHLDFGRYSSLNNPTTGNTGLSSAIVSAANPSNVADQFFEGEDGFRFAWNLQAGATYDLTDNLAIDGSYRFVRIADGNVSNIFADAFVQDDGFTGHEVRFGLRYLFGNHGHHQETVSYDSSPVFK